jgi:DNA-directed RNA polymerase specialized sigma24 family protein
LKVLKPRNSVTQDSEFQKLICRVRQGDQEAATELVRTFEPEIHKSIRPFMINFRLHRVLDMSDVSQPVLATFFARAAAGNFRINTAEQLLKLLLTMARNKVRDEARKYLAQRRDGRRIQAKMSDDCLDVLVADGPTPSKIVAGHELLRAFYDRLTSEERKLAEQRTLGESWATIAAQHGSSIEAVRKKLARGCSRVARQLGMADVPVC